MGGHWHFFLTTFIALIVIIDPPGVIGIFLTITEGDDLKTQRRQAFKAASFTFVILVVFFFAGTYILDFFGITLSAIRLGGGLIIAGIGFQLLRPKDEHKHSEPEREESTQKEDVSFTPLALPLLAGPGALAVVIGASTKTELMPWVSYLLILGAIFLAVLISWVCLREANLLLRILGKNGMGALTRIMGFLLICIAVQMMIEGGGGVLEEWGIQQDLDRIPSVDTDSTNSPL
jgi:multiple antibiotic resistance protein